jgi:1-acyl-sn-glycerol-3-phosphate acyltransferase
VRLGDLASLTAALVPPFAMVSVVLRALRRYPQRLWCAGGAAIGRLAIRVHGTPVRAGAVMYVVNHVSYLDILVLGRLLDAQFVAKSKVAGWPLLGLLARARSPRLARRERPGRTPGRDDGSPRGVTLDVVFHPPVVTSPGDDRKRLARCCQAAVAEGLRHLIVAEPERALATAPA